jgi:WD40 repeat protein
VTASQDKTAKVWDAEDGTCLLTLTGHTSVVYSAAVAPDGHAVITAGKDNKVIYHDRL